MLTELATALIAAMEAARFKAGWFKVPVIQESTTTTAA
jgi:hypothetical protein